MSRELPFPLTFELPPGWSPVSPVDTGAPQAAYAAVRDAGRGDAVVPNIVVTGLGFHDVAVDLAALADAQVSALAARYPVTVLRRDLLADGLSRQVAQLLQIRYPSGDATVALRQVRIVCAFSGADDPTDVAVLEVVMTCAAEVFEEAGPEFAHFVASLTPADVSTVGGQQHRPAP